MKFFKKNGLTKHYETKNFPKASVGHLLLGMGSGFKSCFYPQ